LRFVKASASSLEGVPAARDAVSPVVVIDPGRSVASGTPSVVRDIEPPILDEPRVLAGAERRVLFAFGARHSRAERKRRGRVDQGE
jgi:hypothetical protein